MAVRSSKSLLVGLTLYMICLSARSQVILIPEAQASGVVMKQQLWSLVINNLSSAAKNAILYLTVTDRSTSRVLMEASSALIMLAPGAKHVSYNDLSPVSYAITSIGFSTDRQLTQPLPVGEYLVCYRLFNADNKAEVLVTECIKIIAEPLSPPLLIQPENNTIVMEPRPVLTWTPPAPIYMFNALSYNIIVSPLYEKQSPEEALQRNIPVMTTRSVNNSILYPSTYTDLEAGKTYVWQVVATDAGLPGGKSEVWTFTVMPDSVAQIISNASYVKLVRQNAQLTVVHQGILKAEYFNFLPDSSVNCIVRKITGSGRPGKQVVAFELAVKTGQNFLEYNLNGKIKLNDGDMYEVKLVNSKKEEWMMKFIPRNYL